MQQCKMSAAGAPLLARQAEHSAWLIEYRVHSSCIAWTCIKCNQFIGESKLIILNEIFSINVIALVQEVEKFCLGTQFGQGRPCIKSGFTFILRENLCSLVP